MSRLQRAHAPTPAPIRPPHTSPHRPFEQKRSRSRRRGELGRASAAWFPTAWGRGAREPLGRGRRGARGAQLRSVRPPGSPGWVLGVPSAFREGDSATRSRIEKLRGTKNEGRELGRHHLRTEPRRASAQVRSRTGGPLPHTP